MIKYTNWFFILAVGLLFCLAACDNEQNNVILHNVISENEQQPTRQPTPMESGKTPSAEVSFNTDLLPILSMKCATENCHVAGGPLNLDFSTYQTFINGGVNGPVFIAGDAQGSSIIDEIVSGRMPIGDAPLSAAEIQVFRDWINNQASDINPPVINGTPETQRPPIPNRPPTPNTGVSFETDLMPILTARCAYSGCHDANDPDNLDFRTYDTFIASGDDHAVFIPGNANESEIIEEIVSGSNAS